MRVCSREVLNCSAYRNTKTDTCLPHDLFVLPIVQLQIQHLAGSENTFTLNDIDTRLECHRKAVIVYRPEESIAALAIMWPDIEVRRHSVSSCFPDV
jgi:hypothetical protein